MAEFFISSVVVRFFVTWDPRVRVPEEKKTKSQCRPFRKTKKRREATYTKKGCRAAHKTLANHFIVGIKLEGRHFTLVHRPVVVARWIGIPRLCGCC